MMNKNRSKVILVVLLSTLASVVNAELVLSNTATSEIGEISSESISSSYWRATPFKTDGSNYRLDSILADIAITTPTGGPLLMEIWTAGGANGGPNALLETLTLADEVARAIKFTGSASLSSNTSYFVVLKMIPNPSYGYYETVNFTDGVGGDFGVDAGSWSLENAAGDHRTYTAINGGPWGDDSNLNAPLRMDIQATVIPEPATTGLMGLAAFGLFLARNKTRSRAETIIREIERGY